MPIRPGSGFYLRNPRAVALTSAAGVLFVAEDGAPLEQPGDAASAWSRLLQRLAEPLPAAELRASPALPADLDDALLERLLDAQVLWRDDDRAALAARRNAVFTDNQGFEFARREPLLRHLVFACSGSIVAGLMAPTILSLRFSQLQDELDVILTDTARRFLSADLLEHYGIRTWSDAFTRRGDISVAHVQLGESAGCIVVLPATASTLQRLASGACTDLLGMVVAASRCPLILAPAMNEAMWANAAIQRNVERLRADGAWIVEPTFILGAAGFGGGDAMYGGHGTLWAGPRGVGRVVAAVVERTACAQKAGRAAQTAGPAR